MLTKNDYTNLYLVLKAARADGLDQAQLVVALAAKLQAQIASYDKPVEATPVKE